MGRAHPSPSPTSGFGNQPFVTSPISHNTPKVVFVCMLHLARLKSKDQRLFKHVLCKGHNFTEESRQQMAAADDTNLSPVVFPVHVYNL